MHIDKYGCPVENMPEEGAPVEYTHALLRPASPSRMGPRRPNQKRMDTPENYTDISTHGQTCPRSVPE